eukprot:s660_g3.t2
MQGHVEEVVLDNFKSYEGQVRVGPFKKFTCIVGPNGAGKSNLMDAVCIYTGVVTGAAAPEAVESGEAEYGMLGVWRERVLHRCITLRDSEAAHFPRVSAVGDTVTRSPSVALPRAVQTPYG